MNIILRPRPDGPFYELVPTEGGFRCVPHFADPDADRVLTQSEAAEFALTIQRIEGSLVIGDTRQLLPRAMRA